jgi:hypothetical protein
MYLYMGKQKFLKVPGPISIPWAIQNTANFYTGCSIQASIRQYREANVDTNLHWKDASTQQINK